MIKNLDGSKLTHSYSSIKMYENCPKRYLHERINKEVKFEGNEVTRYGERVHSDLENRLLNGTPLPKETMIHEEVCARIEELTKKPTKLYLEQGLCLNANLTPTGWYDNDAWLRSILDLLIVKENSAIVIDWKTGKRRLDFTQLQLFALQVFKHYPHIKKVKASFVWLKEGAIDSETYNHSDTNLLWADILARIERINQSYITGNFPAKPSGLCPWCPAKNICEYAQL
jgi:hypothetical protein